MTTNHNHFQLIVIQRISEHQAEVERKEEETRERIRAEEKAKLEREQAEAAQKLIDDAAAAAKLAEPPAAAPAPAPAAAAAPAPTTAANVVSLPTPQESAARILAARLPERPVTPPTMKLGDINALLSPINLTAEGLATLGFPAVTVKSAKLYHHHDLTNICAALHDLLDRVQAKQAA